MEKRNVRFERRGIDSSRSYSHIKLCLENVAEAISGKKTKEADEGERTEEGEDGGEQGEDEGQQGCDGKTGRRKSA
jgi:hypothetical protein